jgi:molybdopterin-containing oxidoreductase family membrane subunit
MPARKYVLGSFKEEREAAAAIEALKKSSWELDRVHTPFPSHKISNALKERKSRVGYFTLLGGMIGFFSGFALAVYTAVQWNIIVSGKPVVAWIPFLIVGFEFTILFAVFGNVVGLLSQARLPEFDTLKVYDPRFSGEYFGIVATCEEGEEQKLKDFLMNVGAEVNAFELRAEP